MRASRNKNPEAAPLPTFEDIDESPLYQAIKSVTNNGRRRLDGEALKGSLREYMYAHFEDKYGDIWDVEEDAFRDLLGW